MQSTTRSMYNHVVQRDELFCIAEHDARKRSVQREADHAARARRSFWHGWMRIGCCCSPGVEEAAREQRAERADGRGSERLPHPESLFCLARCWARHVFWSALFNRPISVIMWTGPQSSRIQQVVTSREAGGGLAPRHVKALKSSAKRIGRWTLEDVLLRHKNLPTGTRRRERLLHKRMIHSPTSPSHFTHIIL